MWRGGVPGVVFASTNAPSYGWLRIVHSSDCIGKKSLGLACCGHPAAVGVVACGQISTSCAAAAVAAWARQSAGNPGGVFELFIDGGRDGSSGVTRPEGTRGRVVAIGVSADGSAIVVVVVGATFTGGFFAAVDGFGVAAGALGFGVAAGWGAGRTAGVVGAVCAAALPCDDGESSAWGTPKVCAIVSVMCCSGAGSAPAALNPQLTIVVSAASIAISARRGCGSFWRGCCGTKRGVARTRSSSAIISRCCSTT